MQHLLIATRNAHKTREFRDLLGVERFSITDLTGHPEIGQVEETGRTFEENAILKAVQVSRHFGGLVLGDDSGLEVDALNGAPGVRSARFAGENASDEENCAELLRRLEATGARGREHSGRFRCVIALARQGDLLATFAGVSEGVILTRPMGPGGFGYDPLFVPEGHSETFAQLPAEAKNALSHRGRAARLALDFLKA